MARFTFRLPDIGEGIAEAEVVAWHVKVGDRVEEDAGIADMMTDKATVEMESPVSGVVVELAGEVGDMIPIGSALAIIEVDDVEGEASAGGSETPVEEQIDAETPAAETVALVEAAPEPAPVPVAASEPALIVVPVVTSSAVQEAVLASPAVRARAKDLGVDLSQVKAREGGRVRHSDLDAYLSYTQGYSAATKAVRADEPIKIIGMRRRIAENMAASKRNIPHFTYVDEFDVTALEAMRADLNANRGNPP
jgi:2-oxoisovalerate dehydrogenase E2 component (dihydrolipoyl transacylase)